MAFDKNTEGQSVVQVEKRTTKVNIAMVVGVALFFVFCAIGMAWMHRRTPGHGGNIQPSELHQP